MHLKYGEDLSTVAYPLTFRDALQLQRIITGYTTLASSENADCTATYRDSGWLRRALRADSYSGHGAIQLWWPARRESRSGVNSPAGTSVAGSTTASRLTGPKGDNFSVSQHESGQTTIVGEVPRPVVLVAILKGEENSYSVLKFNSKAAVHIWYSGG